MRSRALGLALFAVGLLIAPLGAEAQQAAKVPRIGVLSALSPSPGSDPAFEAFAQGLRERGWVEGQNIAIEFRWAEGKLERLSDLVRRSHAGALLIPGDPMFILHRTRLADLAAKNRLPVMYGLQDHVDAGGLMSYSPSLREAYRQSATYVDKILKGPSRATCQLSSPPSSSW